MPTVVIPATLRHLTEGKHTVVIDGSLIIDTLQNLIKQYPRLSTYLLDEKTLMPYVCIYHNENDIRSLDIETTPVQASDTLTIVPAIAGG